MRKLFLLLTALTLGGCGSSSGVGLSALGSSATGSPVAGVPFLATKNTTRIDGANAVLDAAAVALAVDPGEGTNAPAVALADSSNWQATLAASVLMSAPLRAPLLLTANGSVPAATATALSQLHPALVIRVGATPAPAKFRSTQISGSNPFQLAANIATYEATATSVVSSSVVVVSANAPAYAMPAAGWAAESGDPILFVTANNVPPATRSAIERLAQPRIYVLGPAGVISAHVVSQLTSLGTVTRIAGTDPVSNAIAFARYSDSDFGWGVDNPGHGLVIAAQSDPAVAGAAAALSASGDYGPLLLTSSSTTLGSQLNNYLLAIEPGYANDPVRGVYNHAWLIGNGQAISENLQAQIDALLEIEPVSTSATSTTPASP